jgi:hypothetical protein
MRQELDNWNGGVWRQRWTRKAARHYSHAVSWRRVIRLILLLTGPGLTGWFSDFFNLLT